LKIAIATVQVPFTSGGAEILTGLLRDELRKRGHQTDIITIPFKWYPTEILINSMVMGRMIDLSEVNGEKIDLVIAMKFPAYYLEHRNKVIWLMHQHRQAYDLWGTDHSDIFHHEDGEMVKKTIHLNDTTFIKEAKKIFTIADNVTARLKKYNDIDATTLYPPPANCDKLLCKSYDDFVFYPSRIDEIKRQRLLVEAAQYVKSNTKFYLAGSGSEREIAYLRDLIANNKLENKVRLLGYITEEEKIDYYARCFAVYFGAFDEDYGYITLESFYSKKPVIVHTDAGGPLEFVTNGENGYIIEPDAKSIAKKIDELAHNKQLARTLGENGYRTIRAKHVDWEHVINSLLSLRA
jgi:glycosyltransferase involved in cell wall biosynthesis